MPERTCGSKFPESGLKPWCGVTWGNSCILSSAVKNENNNNSPVFLITSDKRISLFYTYVIDEI